MDLISPLRAAIERGIQAESEAKWAQALRAPRRGSWADERRAHPELFDAATLSALLQVDEAAVKGGALGVLQQTRAFVARVQEEECLEPGLEAARSRWNDEGIRTSSATFRLSEAWDRLMESPDRTEREAVSHATDTYLQRVAEPEHQRLEEAQGLAHRLGFDSYLALWSRLLELDWAKLETAAARFLSQTHDAYEDVITFLLRRGAGLSRSTSLRSGAWHDLRYLAHTFRPAGAPDTGSMKGVLESWLEAWLQTPFKGKDVAFHAWRSSFFVPGLARPARETKGFEWGFGIDSAAQGIRSALGAAADLARLRHSLVEDPAEARWLVSPRVAETHRGLFRALSFESGFWRTQAGMAKDAAMEAGRAHAALELLCLRENAARVLSQRDLYGGIRTSELPERLAQRMGDALGVTYPVGMAFFQLEGELTPAIRVQGAADATALRQFALEHFDEDYFRNPAFATWLKRRWTRGGRETASALSKAYGGTEAPQLQEPSSEGDGRLPKAAGPAPASSPGPGLERASAAWDELGLNLIAALNR